MNYKIFNRGIATEEGFCNRVEESKLLLSNLNNLTHTLIISPRRFGKTSLALHVIRQAKIPFAYVDLFMKYEKEVILQEFFDGISKLIQQIVTPTEKTLKIISGIFKNIKLSLSFGKSGASFTLESISVKQQNLKNLFADLDELLKKYQKKVVIFVDEIQTITDSEFRDEVEASLRFIAQNTSNIIFIFSGSSRHLLSTIFDDKSRPFYKLCSQMVIKKIADSHYHQFINKFAKQKWKSGMEENTLLTITNITMNHPYYVNVLCEKLFLLEKTPDEADVMSCWQQVCKEEQGSISRDIEFLTSKQKLLLAEIAKHSGLIEPTAKAFVDKVNLTPKGITGALQILYKHDLIQKDEAGKIHLIDPALAYCMAK